MSDVKSQRMDMKNMEKLKYKFKIPVFLDMTPCRTILKVVEEILTILKTEAAGSFKMLVPYAIQIYMFSYPRRFV
jgi:hypothetical protein